MNRYAVIVRKDLLDNTRDKYGTLIRMDYDKDTHIYSVSYNSKFLYCDESYGKTWELRADKPFTIQIRIAFSLVSTPAIEELLPYINLRFTDEQYNNMEEVHNINSSSYQIKESTTGYRCIGTKAMDLYFFDAEDDEAAKVVFIVNTDFDGKFIGDENEL